MDNKLFYDISGEVNGKYIKYKNFYKPNILYWGLGIENELYLEFCNKMYEFNKEDLIKKCKRERYSVDYFTNYNKDEFTKAINYYIKMIDGKFMKTPILLNSNSFFRTDMSNNSKTLYTKLCEPNPKYIGETLIETLQKHNTYFNETMNNEWLFDGDTIEFNTLDFFNITLQDIVNELSYNKHNFITNLNDTFHKQEILKEYGKVSFMENNYPFVTFMTNFRNITMFNNGTLHYNITLPSQLNSYGRINDMNTFIKEHKKAIKIIQWMEPFIIAVYGTPDPFAIMKGYTNKQLFSKSSQRCALSRYIGVGTYNADTMITGKVLTVPLNEIICNNTNHWWFNEFYKNNAYVKLNEIGVDINFNKHYNHGIELRFFEHIKDNSNLFESFEFIIYLMDYILENDYINTFENPIINKIWNQIVLKMIIYGKNCQLIDEEIELYENIFNMKIYNKTINDIYYEIYAELMTKYNILTEMEEPNMYNCIPIGEFSKLAMKVENRKLNIHIINKILYDDIKKISFVNPPKENNSKLVQNSVKKNTKFIDRIYNCLSRIWKFISYK